MTDFIDLYRLMATSGTAPPAHLVEAVERAMLRDHGHLYPEPAARRAVLHGLGATMLLIDDVEAGPRVRDISDFFDPPMPLVMQVVCEPMLPKFPKLPDMPVTRADRRAASKKPKRRLFRP